MTIKGRDEDDGVKGGADWRARPRESCVLAGRRQKQRRVKRAATSRAQQLLDEAPSYFHARPSPATLPFATSAPTGTPSQPLSAVSTHRARTAGPVPSARLAYRDKK
ncbi:hypothetical protein VTN96DRAFT_4604 [Rasamsonia emersonii]